MNVFISWSGQLSKQIGEIFFDWMPTVIQNIKPYFTPADIEKGSKWDNEISKKLSECNTGIIILTKDNLLSPWIMFEAGALSNKLDKSRVCPILIEVDNSDLTGPLSSFQTTKFHVEDIRHLMDNINNQCGEFKLSDKVFNEVFKAFWPQLDEKVNAQIAKFNSLKKDKNIEKTKRSERDILEEILELTRMNSIKKNNNFRINDDIPLQNKVQLREIANNYLVTNKIRLKEVSQINPDDLFKYMEKDLVVRQLAGTSVALKQFISEFIEGNI